MPSGILLWGPPGTGKTLMAEAVAGETGKPYVFVDPSRVRADLHRRRADEDQVALPQAAQAGAALRRRRRVLRRGRRARQPGLVGLRRPVRHPPGAGTRLRRCTPATARTTSTTRPSRSSGTACPDHRRRRAPASTARTQKPKKRGIIMGGMGMGGGGMGALQALLTEMSGLKKPRGFFSRRVRVVPLHEAEATAEVPHPPHHGHQPAGRRSTTALLRPGRLDRIYKVGYPHAGRPAAHVRGLPRQGQARPHRAPDRAGWPSSRPYATGAIIKDIVNEALIIAMRDGRDTITWADMLKAKHLKTHGMPDDWTYGDLERHQVAVHEACHAVAMYRLQKRSTIDVATIERRGGTGGFVAPMPAGGAVQRVAHRLRHQREDVPGLPGRRADAVRGRQLGRRRRRPLQRHPHRDGEPGLLGHGADDRLARGDQGPAGWRQLPARGRHGPQPAGDLVRSPDRGPPPGAHGGDRADVAREPALRAGHRARAGDPQDDHRRRHRRHLPGDPGADARRVGVPHGRLPAVLRGLPPEHHRGPPDPGQAQPGPPRGRDPVAREHGLGATQPGCAPPSGRAARSSQRRRRYEG